MSVPKKGPNHKFFCLRKGERRYDNFTDFFHAAPDVEIHDDLIRYIDDTLLWVPCTHLCGRKKKMTYGLMLYGNTIIKQEGAEIFGPVIESWANLFSKAPSKFEPPADPLPSPVLIIPENSIKSKNWAKKTAALAPLKGQKSLSSGQMVPAPTPHPDIGTKSPNKPPYRVAAP